MDYTLLVATGIAMVMQITIYHLAISSDPALLGSKQLVRHWTPNLCSAMSSKASTSALGQVDSLMEGDGDSERVEP